VIGKISNLYTLFSYKDFKYKEWLLLRAECLYWTFSGLVLILDIGIIGALIKFYTIYQYDQDPKDTSTDSKYDITFDIRLGCIILKYIMGHSKSNNLKN